MRLLGYKTLFLKDDQIMSPTRIGTWEEGYLVASCFGNPYCSWDVMSYGPIEDVPSIDHVCGIYGCAPTYLEAVKYINGDNRFLAIVQGWDKSIIHKNTKDGFIQGFRTKRAKVVALVEPRINWYAKSYYIHYPVDMGKVSLTYEKVSWLLEVPILDRQAAGALVESSWDYWSD